MSKSNAAILEAWLKENEALCQKVYNLETCGSRRAAQERKDEQRQAALEALPKALKIIHLIEQMMAECDTGCHESLIGHTEFFQAAERIINGP